MGAGTDVKVMLGGGVKVGGRLVAEGKEVLIRISVLRMSGAGVGVGELSKTPSKAINPKQMQHMMTIKPPNSAIHAPVLAVFVFLPFLWVL